MQSAQYWKPGEEKPRAGEGESRPASASKDHRPFNSSRDASGRSHRTTDGTMKHGKKDAGDSTRRRQSSGGSDPNKHAKKSKKAVRYSSGKVEESPSSSGGKPAVAAGASQGLLAMKVGAARPLHILSYRTAQRRPHAFDCCTWYMVQTARMVKPRAAAHY